MIREQADVTPDRELLERFLLEQDERAFVALVERYRGMVLGVCRSVLRHAHDAEDISQACFLVLARRGGSIQNPDAVASWLHGVAYRLARKKLSKLACEQAISAADLDRLPARSVDDLTWRELRLVLHQELERLPERLRCPLLLCYLEGKTQNEAARQLGWSGGELRGRLIRGRELLRRRLRRRGLALSVLLLAAGPAPGATLPTVPAESSPNTQGLVPPAGESFSPATVEQTPVGVRSPAPAPPWDGALALWVRVLLACVALVLVSFLAVVAVVAQQSRFIESTDLKHSGLLPPGQDHFERPRRLPSLVPPAANPPEPVPDVIVPARPEPVAEKTSSE
jgi:RNA polymerase sigma factor (sigma-70 family)